MSAINWDKVMKAFTIFLTAGIVAVFGFGVAVAFIHTVLVEIPDPEGMPSGFVDIVLALNAALAVNLGVVAVAVPGFSHLHSNNFENSRQNSEARS